MNPFFRLQTAVTLSILTLISEFWRGFLDAMFVLPVDFNNRGMMILASIIFVVLFSVWAWAVYLMSQQRCGGIMITFLINLIVLIVIPLSWLFVYCPASCQATAGIFNLANTLNLIFGILSGVSVGFLILKTRSEKTNNLFGVN